MVGDLVVSGSSRAITPGPEAVLLARFLDSFAPTILPGHRLSVLREPRLQSGFPDLVFVLWRASVGQQWIVLQASLEQTDLKLLHFLHLSGPTTTDSLVKVRGRRVQRSLEALASANLVEITEKGWRARSAEQIFPSQEIVAVEAKVSSWSAAIRQAHLNTWFASRSYILIPEKPKSDQFIETAKAHGIGVIIQRERPHVVLKAPKFSLPRSYVSWVLARTAISNSTR